MGAVPRAPQQVFTAPSGDAPVASVRSTPPAAPLTATGRRTSDELATGRGLTYEWEVFMANVLDRLGLVEDAALLAASYVYSPSAPAATWTITHNLGTKPHVVIVAADGSELIAEVDYPDNQTTVIVFGQPYTGTAYLRG